MKKLLNLIILFAALGMSQAFAQQSQSQPARIIGVAKDAKTVN
jgi:hypothetical protein